MCGIAGLVTATNGLAPSQGQLDAMCHAIRHRGPDDKGSHIQRGVALGVQRLSIIDLEGGRQPFFNEDRSVRVVFNGEIYNFRELRCLLEGQGHRFQSETDGEVIAHLWEEHGTDFTNHLNGMFAIALHDVRKDHFVLARDRLGIKPLFYYSSPQCLVFGSEIKALLASGWVDRKLDLDALAEFLSWEYVPAPHTLFHNIRKLDPGSRLEVDLNSFQIRVTSWWDLPQNTGDPSQSSNGSTPLEWAENIGAKLRDCVRRQMVSDVPLGAFLSGGVDSSLMVSAMQEPKTFSIGFDDPSYDETQWSDKVARSLGLKHRVEIVKPQVIELFDSLMNFMEDPIGDFSIFPTYLLSRLAREEVTVALSGDGADEIFGGYETYIAQEKAKTWTRISSLAGRGFVEHIIERLRPAPKKKGFVNKAKRFVEGLRHDEALKHTRWRLFMDEATREALFTPAAHEQLERPVGQHVLDLFSKARLRSEVDCGLYVDLKSYLPDNCLVKVDRMSMASSLEVRVPFLDHELVELAFQMPSRLKVNGWETKVLLKQVAAAQVPRECVYRPKEGFSIPIKNWLRKEYRELTEELLSPVRLRQEGIFQSEVIQKMKSEHLEGKVNHSHVLWSLLVFQDWRRRWKV